MHCQHRILRMVALLAAVLFLLALPAAALAAETDPPAQPELSLELFQIDSTHLKITLYGTHEALEYLRAENDGANGTYHYSIVLHGGRDVELHGTFLYEVKHNKPSYVKYASFCTCKHVRYDALSHVVDGDKMHWTVYTPAWFNASTAQLTGADILLNHVAYKSIRLEKSVTAAEAVTDTLMRTSLQSDGALEVRVPDSRTVVVRITDPSLPDGYSNSTSGKGALTPKWSIRPVINSYLWAEATLDGSGGEALDQMKLTAGEFHLNANRSNQFHAKSEPISGASYTVKDDMLEIQLTVPEGTKHDFHQMRWIEVSLHGVKHRYKVV